MNRAINELSPFTQDISMPPFISGSTGSNEWESILTKTLSAHTDVGEQYISIPDDYFIIKNYSSESEREIEEEKIIFDQLAKPIIINSASFTEKGSYSFYISVRRIQPIESLSKEVVSLLQKYKDSDFEENIEEDLSNNLLNNLENDPESTINSINKELLSEDYQPEFVWNLLQFIGAINHPKSIKLRMSFLQNYLSNSSRWIRDGAAIGLVLLGDISAVNSLLRAAERENIADLAKDLRNAAYKLRSLE